MTNAAQQDIVVWSEYAIQSLNWELLDSRKLAPDAALRLTDKMIDAADKNNSSEDIMFAYEINRAVEFYDKNWRQLARMGFRRRSWVIAEVERQIRKHRAMKVPA